MEQWLTYTTRFLVDVDVTTVQFGDFAYLREFFLPPLLFFLLQRDAVTSNGNFKHGQSGTNVEIESIAIRFVRSFLFWYAVGIRW